MTYLPTYVRQFLKPILCLLIELSSKFHSICGKCWEIGPLSIPIILLTFPSTLSNMSYTS